MKKRYARIVFGLPLENPFDYLIPDSLRKELDIGKRVWVPFREEKRVGYCVGISNKSVSSYTKEIISVLDTHSVLSKRFLVFLKEISRIYFSTWGEMIESALPLYLRKGRKAEDEFLKSDINKQPELNNVPIDEAESVKLKPIIDIIEKGEYKEFLIFDDYLEPKRIRLFLELAKTVLKQAKDVLIVVPEISIAQEIAAVFRKSFRQPVLVYYSGLREKQGFFTWSLMREKSPKITIATRMGVFHPKESIGLIIVEDEASVSHKQDESPFYNARDVALMRAKFFKIPLVLAGSPASVETYHKAQTGEFTLIDLREDREDFPSIHTVDLGMMRKKSCISKPLEFKISQALNEGKKTVLFINRRGFSTLIKCLKCGKIIKCRRCEHNLTYHFDIRKIVCHHCGYKADVLSVCPECNSSYLRYLGMGSEKLESELSRIFPQARVARLDLDIKQNENAMQSVLNDFREGRIDILIGTSILGKGLSVRGVGLLGIINLEQGLSFPDFRGSERIFVLLLNLTKLLKDAGRWGELVIQTYNPGNKVITALMRFDYDAIYIEEIKTRKDLKLPPFMNLVILNLRGRNENTVESNARDLSHKLRDRNRNRHIFISEALPHPSYKLRDKFRWQIFIKARNIKTVHKILTAALGSKRRFKGCILTVDVELGDKFW